MAPYPTFHQNIMWALLHLSLSIFSILLYVLGGCFVTVSPGLPHFRLSVEFGQWEAPTEDVRAGEDRRE